MSQVIDEIEQLCGNDVVKQMQLADRVYESLKGPAKHGMELRRSQVQTNTIAGVKMWQHCMTEKHNGRFSNVNRAAMQAVSSAIVAGLKEGEFSEAARQTSFDRQQLTRAQERFGSWLDGDIEQLFETRGKARSDATPPEWLEFAHRFWLDICRPSEKAKDSLRDPKNRSDLSQYRIHWKEQPIRTLHQKCNLAGQEELCAEYNINERQFRESMPFQVKPAGREVCLCVYHLRWQLMVAGLNTARETLRNSGAIKCDCDLALSRSWHS